MHSKRFFFVAIFSLLLVGGLLGSQAGSLPAAAAPAQILLVSSTASHEVLIFDGSSGQPLGKLNAPSASGPIAPAGIAVGADGNYYIASSGLHQILRYEAATWQFKDVFVDGNSADGGGLNTPQGIAFDDAGRLYVASYGSDQILRYKADGTFEGVFVDGRANGGSGLKGPRSLAIGGDGTLFVVDSEHKDVLHFDATTGVGLGNFTSGNLLGDPADLTFGPEGHLYVTSPDNLSVFVFDGTTGALVETVGGSGLDAPRGLAFHKETLFVANQGNSSVVSYDAPNYDWPVFVASGSGGLTGPTWLRFVENKWMPTPTPTATPTVTSPIKPTPTPVPGTACAAVDPAVGPLVWTVNTTVDDSTTALTLRCALTFARTGDTVRFDPAHFPPLAPVTIRLASPLPGVVRGGLVIDGQGAGVVVDGSALAGGNPTLALRSHNNRLVGLRLLNGPDAGLLVEGDNNIVGILSTGRDGAGLLAGPPATPANLFSGHTGPGVLIRGAQNQLYGNFIGTDFAGAGALPNASYGVWVAEGQGNTIADNLISGNQAAGVYLSGENTGENRLLGNRIGLSLDGLQALGNQIGVEIRENAHHNVVGSTRTGEANTIAGNRSHGVLIFGSETAYNQIVHNFIGTTPEELRYSGGNGGDGVLVDAGAHDNAVGLNSAGYLGNVIVHSQGAGVRLRNASKTLVGANRIGQMPSGQDAGNAGDGLHINGASSENVVYGNFIAYNLASGVRVEGGAFNNVIGRDGFSGSDFNVIVRNTSHGIHISGAGSNGNGIINNRIGTDNNGADNLGNGLVGIYLQSGPQQSLIWKNRVVNATGGGIVLDDADNHQLADNWVGITKNVEDEEVVLGNTGHGIYLLNGASHNELSLNIITASTANGVRVEDAVGGRTIANSLSANSIYANGLTGIGLNGGNRGLAAPAVNDIRPAQGALWTVAGQTCAGCRVEFFQDTEDEGQMYLAFASADAQGKFSWTLAPPDPGYGLTLTATDPEGNTSQFSDAYDRTFAALVANFVEVTQAVQSLDTERFPEVPLVAGKRTFLRFHVHANGEPVPGVTARLNAYRGDEWLEPRNVRPNPSTDNRWVSLTPDRSQPDQAFTFWIPGAWTEGTVTFRLEVNPEEAIRELNYNDNRLEKTIEFFPVPAVCVGIVRVRTRPRTASINDPGFWQIIRRAESLYPTPHFDVYNTRHVIEEWGTGPYELPSDRANVLKSLWMYNLRTDDPDNCESDMNYYGIVHPDHRPGARTLGSGYRPGDEAWGFMFTDGQNAARPWDGPRAGYTMAHEIGHNDNRRHVDCGDPDNPDNNYPYQDASGNDCVIGPDDPLAYYGYDPLTGTVIEPMAVGDLMSYRGTKWISDYTYRAIMLTRTFFGAPQQRVTETRNEARSASQTQAILAADELLVVTGLISPTTGYVALDPVYRVVSDTLNSRKVADTARLQSQQSRSEVAYSLRLLDAAGKVLLDQPFALADVSEEEGSPLPLHVLAPAVDGVAQVVVVQHIDGSEMELARRTASANLPSLQLLSPGGGESISDQLTIQWEAGDVDGDPLRFQVQYSPDGGQRWLLLAQDYLSQTLTVDGSQLLGSDGQALVRVTASDGMHSVEAQTAKPFSVNFQPPAVHIDSDGQPISTPVGYPVQLVGRVTSGADGVSPAGFTWRSDLDGALGTGSELYTSQLSRGRHTITLTVTDSRGQSGQASLSVAVGMDSVYLPLVSAAR